MCTSAPLGSVFYQVIYYDICSVIVFRGILICAGDPQLLSGEF